MNRRDVLKYFGLSATVQLVPGAARSSSVSRTMIPFTLEGKSGIVAMTYGITDDPVLSGFDVIPGFHGDLSVCRGYPTIHGVIGRYDGSGYRARCGWLQVVTGKRYRPGDPVDAPYPAVMDIDVPFLAYGTLPALFDAPCMNLNGYDQLRWTADTFLTTLPLRSKSEDIHRVRGFAATPRLTLPVGRHRRGCME